VIVVKTEKKVRIGPTRKSLLRDALTIVETCSGINARLAGRRITQFLDKHLAESGLSISQLGLMAQIAVSIDDDTLGALAVRTGLDQSTLSRNLRGLERAGLVEIAVVEKDLRRRAVWLTEKGARTLEAALPTWRRANSALARLMKPDLAPQLAKATERLVGRPERRS
jgi:DNA-binding MarR family transcriptional regulator